MFEVGNWRGSGAIAALNGNSEQRRKAMGFRNLFQNFFKDCLTQEENEKTAKSNNFTQTLLVKDKLFLEESENNFMTLLNQSKNIKTNSPDEILAFIIQIFNFIDKYAFSKHITHITYT